MAVKKHFEGESRTIAQADVARYNEHLIDDKRFHDEAELQAYMQYRFDLAWCELMNYAHQKASRSSAISPCMSRTGYRPMRGANPKTWLSDTGKAIEISGAPPDNFAPERPGVGKPHLPLGSHEGKRL